MNKAWCMSVWSDLQPVMGLNFNSRVCGTNSALSSITAHLKSTAVLTEPVVTLLPVPAA